MITDQDVIILFESFAKIPLGLTEAKLQTKNRQLFSGKATNKFPVGCQRHLEIYNQFDVIPEYCFDCYKVIIKPRNILELFKLLMIFDSEKYGLAIDNQRKCMVEEREDCSGTYKGFIFCKGIKDGNYVLDLAQKAVYEHISPQVSVALKRGCSEYAKTYPKFPRTKPGKKPDQVVMHYKNSWKTHEEYFDKKYTLNEFEIPPDINDDTSYAGIDGSTTYSGKEVFCMQYWLRYAATIGDKSYLEITGMEVPPIPNLKRTPFK